MSIRYQEDDYKNIPWDKVPVLLKKVGMSYTDVHTHKLSFEASRKVIFAFKGDELVGIGRAISDGVRQAAIYDVAVDPDFQGQNIGREIISRIVAGLPGCSFMLYASPGKEDFYKKMHFKRMKTGMIFFSDPSKMEDSNFVEV